MSETEALLKHPASWCGVCTSAPEKKEIPPGKESRHEVTGHVSKRTLGLILMVIAVTCGALDGTMGRLSQRGGMSIPAILATRWFLLGALLTANECVAFNDTWGLMQQVSDNWDLALVGALCGAGFGCFDVSLLKTEAINAIVLFYTHPMFGIFLSAVLLQEPVEKRTLVALGFAVPFVLMVILPAFLVEHHAQHLPKADLGAHRDHAIGDVIMLVAAVSFASYVTASRYANTARPGTAPCVMVGYGLGAVVMGIAAYIYTMMNSSFNGTLIAYCAILANVLLVFIWARFSAEAASYLTVPEVSLISLLDILLGPGMVMLIYHERPTGLQLIAGISIFIIQVLHEVYGITFGRDEAACDLAVDVPSPCSSPRLAGAPGPEEPPPLSMLK